MALNAKLHIETALKNEKTVLKKSFCTPPLKIIDVTEDKRQQAIKLMLMSSSPGILDGDEYHLKIDVAENSALELQTQSYQRLFHMKKGAKMFLNLELKSGASFVYIPHPMVPHENSVFFSSNKIVMNTGCSLTWGEVMSCGRKLNGEVFKFISYQSVTEIYFGEKLVVKENISMKPSEINVKAIGQLEEFTHQASLVFIGQTVNIQEKIESIYVLLNQQKNIEFGISSLPVNGIIVRLLGYKAEQLFEVSKTISTLLSLKTAKEFYVA